MQKIKRVRLLLLGTGDSGKSTVAKQMKILYLNGYTNEERKNMIPSIHAHVFGCMKDIVKGVQRYGLEPPPNVKQVCHTIANMPASTPLNREIVDMLKIIYNDSEVGKVLQKSSELQIHDHLDYMMGRIDEFIHPTFIPCNDDILKVRVRTTGIFEISYQFEQLHFTVMDMGGQRSERRKWIFFFEDVTAVLFVLALNEYDMRLREEPTMNRMTESLNLFKNIINNQYFTDTPIIFFLNKTDLFREKIQKVDLKQCFPEYNGGLHYEPALKFIQDKFISFNMNNKRQIFTHETCATDTDNLRTVLTDVKVTLMHNVLKEIGIL